MKAGDAQTTAERADCQEIYNCPDLCFIPFLKMFPKVIALINFFFPPGCEVQLL